MSQKALLVSSLLAGLFSTQAFVAEIKFEDQGCFGGPVHLIQHADGFVSGSFDVINERLPSTTLGFGLLSGHCVGTFVVINGEPESNGSCEFADASGDKYLGVFHRKGDPTKAEGDWHVVHGTGKFAGMAGEAKYKQIGEFPPASMPNTIGGCDRASGTYNAPGIK